VDAFDLAKSGSKKENGKDIVCFQIVVVGKDFFSRHARAEKFKDKLNGIAQPPNARFAMTNIWMMGDALQQLVAHACLRF